MPLERTLFIVKPDAVERNLIGKILAHVEDRGFRIVEARLGPIAREEAERFYAEHRGKPFFLDLLDYMTKNGLQFAPAVAGEEAAYVALHRALAAYSAGANLAAEK